jgi:hypothetical protein
MRLSEASEAYLEVRHQEGFSSHTINAYRLQHKILIRDIGDLDLCQVTLQLLRDSCQSALEHALTTQLYATLSGTSRQQAYGRYFVQ